MVRNWRLHDMQACKIKDSLRTGSFCVWVFEKPISSFPQLSPWHNVFEIHLLKWDGKSNITCNKTFFWKFKQSQIHQKGRLRSLWFLLSCFNECYSYERLSICIKNTYQRNHLSHSSQQTMFPFSAFLQFAFLNEFIFSGVTCLKLIKKIIFFTGIFREFCLLSRNNCF